MVAIYDRSYCVEYLSIKKTSTRLIMTDKKLKQLKKTLALYEKIDKKIDAILKGDYSIEGYSEHLYHKILKLERKIEQEENKQITKKIWQSTSPTKANQPS